MVKPYRKESGYHEVGTVDSFAGHKVGGVGLRTFCARTYVVGYVGVCFMKT